MDGDVVIFILKAFGPAGGLSVLLLGASVWANWKLVLRITVIETDHVVAIEKCKTECEKEKLAFSETLNGRYREAVATFLQRDQEKRQDINVMYERFEKLLGVVADGLTKVTQANENLRFELKGRRGS